MAQQDDDHTVLHQEAHQALIEESLDGIDVENEPIADLAMVTGGGSGSPTRDELNLTNAKVNSILTALRNSKIIPTS